MTPVVVALAAAKVLLYLWLSGDYGYTAAELYLLACSERLDWGYVDVPPLAVYLTLAARVVVGGALSAVRLAPALAGGMLVLVTAQLAHRLGAGRFGVGLAALAVALSPAFVAANASLGPNTYAPLFLTSFVYVWVGLLQTGRRRTWVTLGILAGATVGLNPPMCVFFAALLLMQLVSRARTFLGGGWPWLGGATALFLIGPSLLWQATHGWPVLPIYFGAAASDEVALVREWVAAPHVAWAPLWFGGLLALLFLPPLGSVRAVGWAVLPVGWFAVAHDWDSVVLLCLFPMLFATGALWTDALSRARWLAWMRTAVPAVIVVAGLSSLPSVVPLLPLEIVPSYWGRMGTVVRWPHAPQAELRVPAVFAEMIGWREKVDAVRRALDTVPPGERAHIGIWARSRGDAAAIDRLGPRLGLPRAASADGNYAGWGPGADTTTSVITLGFSAEELRRSCGEVRVIETIDCALCPPQRRQATVHHCSEPRVSWRELWRGLDAAPLERWWRIE